MQRTPQTRFPADTQLPEITFAKAGGGEVKIGGSRAKYSLVMVYRGAHCPRCKSYLNRLENMRAEWDNLGVEIAVVSADSREKAEADVKEFGWTFDVGYGLEQADMERLGVYITEPLSPNEADGNFAEPGMFFVKPSGDVQLVAISNGPAVRPDLADLLDGARYNIKNDRPTRGTV